MENNTSPLVYAVQVSGISCTNCAAKIKRAFAAKFIELQEKDAKVEVNIIKESLKVTVSNEKSISILVQTLEETGFKVIGEALLLSGGSDNHREAVFLVSRNMRTEQLQEKFHETLGIVNLTRTIHDEQIKFNIKYNCQIIKGRQIGDIIEVADPSYIIVNSFVESFKREKKIKRQGPSMLTTGLLCSTFLIVNMILPFTGSWYQSFSTFPSQFGIYSLVVLLNIILATYVVYHYSAGFIKRAYKSYRDYGETNMETLIALGAASSLFLFLFFMVMFTAEWLFEKHFDVYDAISNINSALSSASIIVLVVTIGKHFENKIKDKIEKLTDSIFPQSVLFENMRVQVAQIKNRKLIVNSTKEYDVSLVEKQDILKGNQGRLLLDVIVISGYAKATQSLRTGCDEVQTIGKGERIESGAIIHEFDDLLVEVENVFEKSLLVEIGTQIKLSQNQESSEESGIQAVCRTIANYFVKGVIILSIITMLVWMLVIEFSDVKLPTCDACWIVQRGIGVLVASCPCALGLAVPSVIAIVLNLAVKSGILIRKNNIFEKIKNTKNIAFDKTGTLFTRINKIQHFELLKSSVPIEKLWEIIALVERQIRHPLAQVLHKQAFHFSKVIGTNYSYLLLQKPLIQKEGITSVIQDKKTDEKLTVWIGNIRMLQKRNISIPEHQIEERVQAATQLFLCVNQVPYLTVYLDTHSNLRPEAKDVIKLLEAESIQIHILSGDSRASVQKLGQFLEIPSHQLHPEQSAIMKMEWIKDTQAQPKNGVIMIGDGLNDIPCLQEAEIGVSINAKSELNLNASDVVLLHQNLYKILALIRLTRKGNLFIKINLFWAFAYNIVMMPIVAGVFFKWNVVIQPAWSSVAMSLSSIIVVAFSHLLSLFTYDESLKAEKVSKEGLMKVPIGSKEDSKYEKLQEENKPEFALELSSQLTKETRDGLE